MIVIPCLLISTTIPSPGWLRSLPVTITDAGPVTRQLVGSISAAGTGMFKQEVGPGVVICAEGEAAVTASAGDIAAAIRLIAMAPASARSEIRNRMVPSQ